jgi:hypothetical protein
MSVFLIVTTYALSKAYKPREVALHVIELFAVFLYVIGVIWGLETLLGPGGGSLLHDAAIGVAKLAVCLVALLPWAYLAQRRYGALSTIGGLLRSAARRVKARRAPAPAEGTV